MLLMLIDHAGEIATRDEIKDRLWPNGTVVEFEYGINNTVKNLRRELGDSADDPSYIQTIKGRGYRLMVPVDIPEHDQARSEEPPARRLDSRRRVAAICLAVIAVLTAAGIAYRRMHAIPKLTDKDTIVLADFEDHTGDPVLDDALNAALTVELQQSPFLNLLAPDKVRATLKQMNRPETERMTAETALKVCRQTRSAALVTGSIADEGNQYELSLKATSCQTGKELARADVTADSRNQIVHALGEAGYKLRSKLGEPQASLRDFNEPLDIATSASLEALEAFARGRNEQNTQGNFLRPFLISGER